MKKLLPFKTLGMTALFFLFTYASTWAVSPPTITSFSPTSGAIGTTVTITGTNFNTTAANNVVFFGATKATVTSATTTSLIVTVPVGATYQPFSVTDISTGLTVYSVKPFITTFNGSNAFDSYSFNNAAGFLNSHQPLKVTVCDLDGDGKVDIIAPDYTNNVLSVISNTSSVGTISFATEKTFTLGTHPTYVATGDLDGDGKPDVVVTNAGSNTISIFRNTSTINNISFASRIDSTTGSIPYCVAIGDIDGDGKPDIAVANTSSNTISVFKNNSSIGTISFNTKKDFIANGSMTSSIVFADIDGDGKPDMVIKSGYYISIFRNTSSAGSISFASRFDISADASSECIIATDLDGDGKPDIVSTSTGKIAILRNTSSIGTISFGTEIDYTTNSYPRFISATDIDGDGKPDIAVANSSSDNISIYRNNCISGTISFATKVDFNAISTPEGLALADLDGDGKPDIISAKINYGGLVVWQNNVLPVPTITSFTPASATSGDTITISGTNFTGTNTVTFGGVSAYSFKVVSSTSITAVIGAGASGNIGVIVNGRGVANLGGFTFNIPPAPTISSCFPLTACTGNTVTITGTSFIGTTFVSFGGTPAQSFKINSFTSITAIVGTGTTGNISISTPGGTANMVGFTFVQFPTFSSFSPTSGAVGTTVTITGTNFNTTLANNAVFFGATKATVLSASATSLTASVPYGATYDKISVTDITTGITVYSTKPFNITFSGSNAFDPYSFANKVDFATGTNPQCVATGDLDGNGAIDLVVANYGSNTISVFRNISTNGTISFATKQDFATGSGPNTVTIGDIDGDGRPDLVVSNKNSNTISVFKNNSTNGTISFEPKVDYSVGGPAYHTSICDIDGDGRADLFVGNYNNGSVFHNIGTVGSITFAPRIVINIMNSYTFDAMADLDGDKKPDLVAANDNTNLIVIMRNTSIPGTISFDYGIQLNTGISPNNISITDLDSDGKSDIVVTNSSSGSISVLRNTSTVGSISMATHIDYVVNSSPYCVVTGDIDGDGKPDLVIGYSSGSNISVFKNISSSGSISLATKVDYTLGNVPCYIAIGDIDGDGKPDMVITNKSSNTFSVLKNSVLPAPKITSFTPITATSGNTVTITGANFVGTVMAQFGGTAAYSSTLISPTSITAIVNSGASGKVSVYVPGGGIDSLAGFTYSTPPIPTITSFTPVSAIQCTTVTITGTNFIGTTAVKFGGTAAVSFTVVSATSITAILGIGSSGSISVTTPGGTATLAGFTFLPPPAITSFSPTSGATGTTVTITGTNFNTTLANNIVFFGAIQATVTSATTTSLTVAVPIGATYQPLSVSDISTGLTAYSSQPFITTFPGSNAFDSYSFAQKVDFTSGTYPSIISIGDLDGDGKSDIVVVNTGSGTGSNTISVLLNTSTVGTVSFAPKVDFVVGTKPLSVSIGDLDGDGKPDLVIANYTSNTVSVLRNTSTIGNVLFASKVDYATGSYPYCVSIGDLDRDGKPEIVVTNYGSNTVSIFRNNCTNGTISFASKVDFTTGSSPISVSINDIDGDGSPDLAVSNYASNTISVLRSTCTNGTISFAPKIDYTTGTGPYNQAIGDLDGDGKPDLAVVNYSSNTVSVLRNTSISGTISFATKVDYTTGSSPVILAISDLDGDGKPDLALVNNASSSISVFRNLCTSGTISFSAKLDYPTGANPRSIAIGDIDGDGKPDIEIANYSSSNSISVLKSNALPAPKITSFTPTTATWGDTVTIIGSNFTGTTSIQFGRTSALSFKVVSSTSITAVVNTGASGKVSVYVPGGGTDSLAGFTYTTPPAPTITSFTPANAIQDATVIIYGANLIGASSVMFGNTAAASYTVVSAKSITATLALGSSGNVSVTTPSGNTAKAGFTFLPPPAITSFSPTSGATGTTVTITGTNFNTTLANNIVFFGAIQATVTSATTTSLTVAVPIGATYQPLSVSDISTGLTAYSSQPFITTFPGSNAFDSYSFAQKVDFTSGTYPSIISIGDLDGDGKSDIVVVNTGSGTGSNTMSVLLNTSTVGTVSFAPKVDFVVGTKPLSVSIGDLDGDGKPDLVVANYTSNTVSVLRNTSTIGNVLFASKVDYATGSYPYCVSIGDLDRDGKPEIVVTNYGSNTVSIFRNNCTNGTISFASKVDFTTGSSPISVSINDIDGDGSPDLAVSNYASNTISVLRSTCTNGTISFAPKIDYTTGTGPYNQAIGDLDGDGKPDLAVVNYSSNTVSVLRNTSISGTISFATKVDYTTGSSPVILAISDLDGDGKPDLALVNNASSSISVFRNLCTSGTISFSAKLDYPTGANPRSIAIGDIDGDGKPDIEIANYSSSNSISVLKSNVLPTPKITSFTPTTDHSGDTITIAGSNFNVTPVVQFGGTAANSVKLVSPTIISAVIGNGTSGSVSVYIPGGGTASLAGFIYIPVPTITSFTPTSGSTGTVITITGTNFTGATAVSFGGKAATSFTIVSSTSINAVVATGASGSVSVTTPGGTATLVGYTFMPPPTITSFTPTSGAQGTLVTISGTNFNTIAANNIVFFGAAMAKVSSATSTSLIVTVPTNSTFKPISVTNLTTGLSAYATSPFNTTFNGGAVFNDESFAAKVDNSSGINPYSVYMADIDGDGMTDIIVVSGSKTVSVYRNTSSNDTVLFAPKINFITGTDPSSVSIGDLDGDGKPDIVVTNSSDNTVSVFKNSSTSGSVSFANKVDFITGSTPVSVTISDLDGDGWPDLVVANQFSNSISVLRNITTKNTINSTSFASKVDYATGNQPKCVLTGNLDGNGKLDIAIANWASNTISLFRNTSSIGTISFNAKVDYNAGSGSQSISIGDLDGDGKPDLVVANSVDIVVSLFHNTSSSDTITFDPKIDLPAGNSPFGISICDMNGDGKLDLAVVNSMDNNVSIYNNTSTSGSISFATKYNYLTGSNPVSISAGDINGDGKPDLVIVNENDNTVSVIRNTSKIPTLISFAPTSGSAGATITISGTDFTEATLVSFGGTAATSFNVLSPTSISAVVSTGASGNVSVTTPNGMATRSGFTFIPIATIASFYPTSGSSGATVTIKGVKFTGTTAIYFGGTAAASFKVVSDTIITAIVASGASGNVSLTSPGGTETLSGFTYLQDQTITFNALNQPTYGNADFDPGAIASSLLNVSYTSSNSFVATIVSNHVHIVGAGSSIIYANQAGNATYNAAPQVSQALLVNKAMLIVSVKDTIRKLGQPNPPFIIVYSGFVNMDSAEILDTKPTAICNANVSSVVGTYPITVSGGVDNNYNFTYTNGNLTITPATGIIDASIAGYYIYPNPADDAIIITGANVDKANVMIFDLSGRLMLNCKVMNGRINLQKLVPGIYNLKIDSFNYKLIKQ